MGGVIELLQVDEARNRFRVYRLREQGTLFGERDLLIEWGRLGQTLRVRVERYGGMEELERRKEELVARRRAHGYEELKAERVSRVVAPRVMGAGRAAEVGRGQLELGGEGKGTKNDKWGGGQQEGRQST